MWSIWIVVAVLALVLVEYWWHRRQRRTELANATKKFEEAAARQQRQTDVETQSHQRALFDSMIEGVLLLDALERVQFVNQSLTRLLSLKSDVRGRTLVEAFRWPALQELVDRVAVEKRVVDVELEFPNTSPRWLQVNGTASVDSTGKFQGAMLVFHDMTRLKELENTRKEFVANVSHELRTPLSMIKGYVETLLDGAKTDSLQAVRFLQIIDKHTDRLVYLIEDLLTISRLESGQIVMNRQRIQLQGEVDRVVTDLQSRAAGKHIKVENKIGADQYALADADRLQQVLFNLIENAIKYGRNEGCVKVEATTLPENSIQVWVQDDGPGIPPDAKDRVFERFFRVDKARSRETGGTGLGLAIVKHIVQAHGGRVWIESELGHGATFFFTLPNA